MSITGTIKPGYYLKYEAGSNTIGIYDPNWNLMSTPSFNTSGTFNVPEGAVTISVTHTGSSSVGLETQFIVDDTPYRLATNDLL